MSTSKISPQLEFFINLGKAKTVIARRFDNRLGFFGLGFSDFMILIALSQAPEEKMRRIDLAERVGLTASGVTRMLLPMEKIGLIKKEANERDARVSYVTLAPGGKRLLASALENAEVLSQDLLTGERKNGIKEFSALLVDLGKTVVY